MADKWVCNGVEFCKGDHVKVVRKIPSFDLDGMGSGIMWENEWVDADHYDLNMDGAIGQRYTIYDIIGEGVEFVEDGQFSYLFPLAALEKVTH